MENKQDQSFGKFLFGVSAFFVLLAGFIGIINRFLYTIPIWVFYGLSLLGVGIFGYGLYTLLFSFPEGDDVAAVEEVNGDVNTIVEANTNTNTNANDIVVATENTQETSMDVENIQIADTNKNTERQEEQVD